MDDSISHNPLVIASLTNACALPRDIERHREVGSVALMVASMQLALSIVQSCQVVLEKTHQDGSKVPRLEAEKKDLEAALGASN